MTGRLNFKQTKVKNTVEIPLNKNKVAIVDPEDYEYLMQWKWNAHFSQNNKSFYAMRSGQIGDKWTTISMHRLILGVTDPKIHVDHIDHNTLNNSRDNLRIATHAQNCANRKAKKNGTSKYLGVDWHKASGKWQAKIRKNKKTIHIGIFDDEIAAAHAYDKAAIELHKEFSNPNFKNNQKLKACQ